MLKYHQGSFYILLHCLDSNLHCIYLQMKCLLYILCFGSVTSDVISLPGQDNEYYQTSSWSDTQTGLQRSSILTSRPSESCWYSFPLEYNTVPKVGMWYKQPFSNGPWPFTPILFIQKWEVWAGFTLWESIVLTNTLNFVTCTHFQCWRKAISGFPKVWTWKCWNSISFAAKLGYAECVGRLCHEYWSKYTI